MKLSPIESELTPEQRKAFKEGIKTIVEAKPSELINIALKDLARAERSKDYTINMGVWHELKIRSDTGSETCAVCFAGSVMAGTLKIPKTVEVFNPDVAGRKANDRLAGLNWIREGYVSDYLLSCGIPYRVARDFEVVDVPYYSNDKDAFKKAMRSIIKLLRKHDL